MKKEHLDAIKIRAEKYLAPNGMCVADIKALCQEVLDLKEQNALLRQNLFELEQRVPEEQQWQNVISNKLERACSSNDGNYYEINNSINNVTFTISIHKKFGKTPVQLLKQSETRRLKAAQKIVNLKKQLSELTLVTQRLKSEVDVLEKIGTPEVGKEPLSKEKLEVTLKVIRKVCAAYNSTYYNREVPKLHDSMKNLLQEVMGRASQAEYAHLGALAEIKRLKKEFLKRKFPNCRIYKKRRKRGMKKRRLALHY